MVTSISYRISNSCRSKRIMVTSIICSIEIIYHRINLAVIGCSRNRNCNCCIIVVIIGRQRVVARTSYCRVFSITTSIFDIWCWSYCIITQVGNYICVPYCPVAVVTRFCCCNRNIEIATIICKQSLDVGGWRSCRSIGIAKVHVFFASRERTSSYQMRSLFILYNHSVCCFVLALQSIVVGNMQRYPVGTVAIIRIVVVIVRNNRTNCESCFILSSRFCTIQSKVARPSVCIARSCCFNVSDNFLSTNIRTNIAKVWECYYWQRLNNYCNASTLSTVIIVSYIDMVSCCRFWSNSYCICIIKGMHSRVYTIIPYIIVIRCTESASEYSKCRFLTLTYSRRCCLYPNIGRIFYKDSSATCITALIGYSNRYISVHVCCRTSHRTLGYNKVCVSSAIVAYRNISCEVRNFVVARTNTQCWS